MKRKKPAENEKEKRSDVRHNICFLSNDLNLPYGGSK